MTESLHLVVTPKAVRSGELVRLSLSGSDARSAYSGLTADFEQAHGGEWIKVFTLVTADEQGKPSFWAASEEHPVPLATLSGEQVAVVPPVAPGEYRISRSYSVPGDDRDRQVELHATLTVRSPDDTTTTA